MIATIVSLGIMTSAAPAEPTYTVARTESLPTISAAWDDTGWKDTTPLDVAAFHPRSSDHRPRTQAKLLHDGQSIAVIFRVEDEHVLARHTEYQAPTHLDSCVEFFVRPPGATGYFNFEFNAIGTLLLWYVEDPRRINGGFAKYTPVDAQWAHRVAVHTSLTEPIPRERHEPTVWTVSFRVPLDLMRAYAGDTADLDQDGWRANFYKCADDSAHPHWGAWAEVGERLDFHQPDRFGTLVFE